MKILKFDIEGLKFDDLNGNGQKDRNEPFLAGIQFMLYDTNGREWGPETTNDDGEFWFTDLLPGTYLLEELGSRIITTHQLRRWKDCNRTW